MAESARYAVLTGDIVKSSRYRGALRRRLHAALLAAGDLTRRAFPAEVPKPPDIYRGDSWQMLVRPPDRAVRIGLYFRTALRAALEDHTADSRIAVGVGTVDYLPGNGVAAGDGEAYRVSGALLERMPAYCRMTLSVAGSPADPLPDALAVVVRLVDALAQQWTVRQAKAVSGALLNYPQEKIAKELWESAVSQQAVAQHLRRARWHAVQQALVFLEEGLRRI